MPYNISKLKKFQVDLINYYKLHYITLSYQRDVENIIWGYGAVDSDLHWSAQCVLKDEKSVHHYKLYPEQISENVWQVKTRDQI